MTHTGAAVIDVGLAVDPSVSRLTLTTVATNCVYTVSSILTWALLALIYIFCALGSYTHIPDRHSDILDRFSSTNGYVI